MVLTGYGNDGIGQAAYAIAVQIETQTTLPQTFEAEEIRPQRACRRVVYPRFIVD
jgi:3-oxoacyl-(acyl-carrier-protein) synthase